MHFGDIPAGITLYVPFATYLSGVNVTMSGFAVGDIKIYKNGSTTERASTSGFTLLDTDGIDFDGITGIHGFSIDLNDNTTAGFFSVGGFYWIFVSTITVSGQTISLIAGTFRIVAAENTAGYPAVDAAKWNNLATVKLPLVPATAGRELVVDAAGLADANAVKVGPTGSGTAQTAGDIMADTNDIQTRLPAALVGGRMDSSTGAMAAGVMTAAAAAADLTTELQSGLATAANLATVAGYLDTEIAAILAAVDTEIGAVQTDVTTLLGRLTAARAGYLDFLNGTVPARLKKNTAFTNFMFKMELSADGAPGTGLTVTVQRALDGGGFAALAVATVTEIAAGWYKCDLAASDLNGNNVAFKATATGAKQLDLLIVTQAAGS